MNSPPLTTIICTHLDQEQGDNQSEVTNEYVASQANNYGIKLAADPYFYYTLDERHSLKNSEQEINALKIQLARQQEKLDMLSSKLSQSLNENEVLKAENNELTRELARRTEEKPIRRSRRASTGCEDERLQFLLNTNEKLVKENARQEVLFSVMRKSFQNYVKDQKDRKSIEELQKLDSKFPSKISSCEGTAQTELETLDFTGIEFSQRSGSTWMTKGVDIETTSSSKVSERPRLVGRRQTMTMCDVKSTDLGTRRNKSEGFFVSFDHSRRGRRRSIV